MKTTTGETVLYSGREDDLHYEGVAIIMKKGMEKYLMEWKPVKYRIIQARFKGRQTNLSIIYNAMHLLMTATTEIKKPFMSNCKQHLRTSIVETSC